MNFRALGALTVAAALFFGAAPVSAFTVDGIVSSDDNYTVSYDLNFYVWNTDNGNGGNQYVNGGKLRIGRDGPSGDMYMMVEIPTTIVDNVYGNAANTAGSGWSGGHPFNDLRYSDSFEFSVNTIYGDKFIEVDYLNSSTNRAGITNSGYGALLDVASSLEYNLAQGFGDTSNSPDPIAGNPDEDWVQTVQYEFQLKGSKFSSGDMIGLADLSWAYVHASPNKLKGNSKVKLKCLYYNNCELSADDPPDDPPGPSVEIPAPAGSLIFGMAAGMIGFMRRRRKLTV